MPKFVYRFIGIISYMLVLLGITGFELSLLFNIREILLVLAGTILLTISSVLESGFSKIHFTNIIEIASEKAVQSGLFSTVLFIFTFLSNQKEINFSTVISDVTIRCRPLLYGFVLQLCLNTRNSLKTKNNNIENENSEVKDKSEKTYEYYREKGLSRREAEIARLVKAGRSNPEIAEELFIALSTVKKHIQNIFEKLDINSRDEI